MFEQDSALAHRACKMVAFFDRKTLDFMSPRCSVLTLGFSIDLNFQDVMTSKLKNLDVSVQNLEVMQ